MQKTFYALLITFIALWSCEMRSTSSLSKKKYCGLEMSEREVIDVTTRGKGFEYSDKDMDLHSEIAYFAQEIGGDSIIIEVFFILSNEKELGIYLFGPDDIKVIEKMNCAILTRKYKNQMPSRKFILYYNENDEGRLIAKIKSDN